jgi:hypothetical protein
MNKLFLIIDINISKRLLNNIIYLIINFFGLKMSNVNY